MDQPDPTIHQPVRLKIMAALKPLPDPEMLEFVRLKAIVGATEGNLGAHITTLEEAGYVSVAKSYQNNRPLTTCSLTTAGRKAFSDYVDLLEQIVQQTRKLK